MTWAFLGGLGCAMTVAHGAEWRGWWVDAFHPGMKSATEVARLVSDARRANVNTLVVQVRRRGDAYYRSSLEPMASDVVPQSWDPLAELLRLAHDTSGGKARLDVHAWIVTYNIWNGQSSLPSQATHPYRLHPDWLTQDAAGTRWDGANYAFDPGHPAVQDHTVAVALEIVTRYPVDGLHLDYIRYNGSAWGYHPVAVARFQKRHGRTTIPAASDSLWRQFRREQVTSLVRRVYLATTQARPTVRVSAATITFAPGITTTAEWPTSAAYREVLQDWRGWMEEGILDVNMPMAYFRQGANGADWTSWSTFAKRHRYGRQVVLGAATYLNSPADSLRQLRSTRDPVVGGARADGMMLYSYASPANDGTSVATWVDVLRSGLAGDVLPPLLADPEPVPGLPWKDQPTQGHLLGRIAGADGAVVSLVGAGTRTLGADANGWFGAVGLNPGEVRASAVVDGVRWLGLARIEPGKVSEPRMWRADEDADGDGATAEQELLLGSDPARPGDLPRAELMREGGRWWLRVGGVPGGRSWKVWRADAVGPGASWRLVGQGSIASASSGLGWDASPWMLAGEAGFFRVEWGWAP